MVKIPSKIIKELERIRNTEGYLLTGSHALGKISKNSDWDFFMLLKDNLLRWRKTWLVDNEWLEIFCNDKKQINKYFQDDLKEGRGVNLFMLATGEIIKDNKKRDLHYLQIKAKKLYKKGPNKLSIEDRQWIDYNIAVAIQDIEDLLSDNNPEILLINNAINDFVKYYYRLSGIWLPRPKERFCDFLSRERKLRDLMKNMEKSEWRDKASLAIKLGKFIGKKFKLSLNGFIYLRPKK